MHVYTNPHALEQAAMRPKPVPALYIHVGVGGLVCARACVCVLVCVRARVRACVRAYVCKDVCGCGWVWVWVWVCRLP